MKSKVAKILATFFLYALSRYYTIRSLNLVISWEYYFVGFFATKFETFCKVSGYKRFQVSGYKIGKLLLQNFLAYLVLMSRRDFDICIDGI